MPLATEEKAGQWQVAMLLMEELTCQMAPQAAVPSHSKRDTTSQSSLNKTCKGTRRVEPAEATQSKPFLICLPKSCNTFALCVRY